MPCHVEESPAEIAARQRANQDRAIAEAIKPFKNRNDHLTHENDILRELILNLAEISADDLGEHDVRSHIPDWLYETIVNAQVEHRKEDLRRLEKTFTDKILEEALNERLPVMERANNVLEAARKLDLVRQADPEKPLEAQLGFDPDDF